MRHSQRAWRTVDDINVPRNCQEQTKADQECKAALTCC